MAKNKQQKKPSAAPVIEVSAKPAGTSWMPWAIGVAAVVLYSSGFSNQMVGMDDHSATLNNPAVRDLDFFGRFNLGMYAPITWLGYAIAYHLGGKSPFWFHLLSACIHAVNAAVVFRLFFRLSDQNRYLSFAIALFFAIHPIQVEAVSWIAAFSTPLFSLFYLLALERYTIYASETQSKRHLWIAVGLFLAACLAKSAAVTLPLTLMVIDGWLKKPLSRKTLLEKAPFFIISLIFGLLTLYSRGQSGHTVTPFSHNFDGFDRFLMACHTVIFYWTKIFIPNKLSIWYPFEKTADGDLPFVYYAAPFLLAGVLILAWRFRKQIPVLWFGILFYLSCVILALPYYTIGTFELRSDRYNYLPILGILAIISSLPFFIKKWKPSLEVPIWVLLGIAGLYWVSVSLTRIRDWRDTLTIMDSALAATGDNFGQAYLWRGMEYGDRGNGRKALEDFNRAIEINPSLTDAYRYRGLLLGVAKQYEKSIADLDQYLAKHPKEGEIYFNRALSHLNLGHMDEALNDLNRTIELLPKFERAYKVRGNIYQQTGQQEKAEADYKKVSELTKR